MKKQKLTTALCAALVALASLFAGNLQAQSVEPMDVTIYNDHMHVHRVLVFDAEGERHDVDARRRGLPLAAEQGEVQVLVHGASRIGRREFEAAEARQDREAVRALNYRFHSQLYAAAQQPQTLHFVQVLWAKYPFDLINLIKGRPARATAEHRHLLKAMKAGDRQAVATSVREHIEAGWRELQVQLTAQETRAGGSVRKRKA